MSPASKDAPAHHTSRRLDDSSKKPLAWTGKPVRAGSGRKQKACPGAGACTAEDRFKGTCMSTDNTPFPCRMHTCVPRVRVLDCCCLLLLLIAAACGCRPATHTHAGTSPMRLGCMGCLKLYDTRRPRRHYLWPGSDNAQPQRFLHAHAETHIPSVVTSSTAHNPCPCPGLAMAGALSPRPLSPPNTKMAWPGDLCRPHL